MTTPLEKKSAEIAALVAALSVRIRRNSNERCFEYRCSEHHEWQHLCYGSDDSDIRKALAELQRVEAARRAWPDRVERARFVLAQLAFLNIEPDRQSPFGTISVSNASGDAAIVRLSRGKTHVRVLLVGEEPLDVRTGFNSRGQVIEAAIARWGSDVVPEGGDGIREES